MDLHAESPERREDQSPLPANWQPLDPLNRIRCCTNEDGVPRIADLLAESPERREDQSLLPAKWQPLDPLNGIRCCTNEDSVPRVADVLAESPERRELNEALIKMCCCVDDKDEEGPLADLHAEKPERAGAEVVIVDSEWISHCELLLSIRRSPGLPLGIDIDLMDDAMAQVCGIGEGCIQCYNEECSSRLDLMVKLGDFIVEVNRCRGDVTELHRRLQSDLHLSIVVKRPKLFQVYLYRSSAHELLGMDLQNTPYSITIMIHAVVGGLVHEWNKMNPERQIKECDRIAAVNGKYGDTEQMMQQLVECPQLQLLIMDLHDDGPPGLRGWHDDNSVKI